VKGRASSHLCAFCGEPAVAEQEISPAVYALRGDKPPRVKTEVKRATMAWVCGTHNQRVEKGRGWQDRAKDRSRHNTRQAKQRLKRDQGRLW